MSIWREEVCGGRREGEYVEGGGVCGGEGRGRVSMWRRGGCVGGERREGEYVEGGGVCGGRKREGEYVEGGGVCGGGGGGGGRGVCVGGEYKLYSGRFELRFLLLAPLPTLTRFRSSC